MIYFPIRAIASPESDYDQVNRSPDESESSFIEQQHTRTPSFTTTPLTKSEKRVSVVFSSSLTPLSDFDDDSLCESMGTVSEHYQQQKPIEQKSIRRVAKPADHPHKVVIGHSMWYLWRVPWI